MQSEVQDYLAKLKLICTEPNEKIREAVSSELIASLSSSAFIGILTAIFEPTNDVYDSGTSR